MVLAAGAPFAAPPILLALVELVAVRGLKETPVANRDFLT
jgi:hypothetical protein